MATKVVVVARPTAVVYVLGPFETEAEDAIESGWSDNSDLARAVLRFTEATQGSSLRVSVVDLSQPDDMDKLAKALRLAD